MHHGEIQQENPVIYKQREKISLVVMAKKFQQDRGRGRATTRRAMRMSNLNLKRASRETQQENPAIEK